jgi:hypothetical protein
MAFRRLASGTTRTLVSTAAALILGAGSLTMGANQPIDLDGSAATGTNGKESSVALKVVSTSPVKVKDTVTNSATAPFPMAFRFEWPAAGPGGFASSVGLGTPSGVGAIWTWQTLQVVYAINGRIDFTRTIPDTPAYNPTFNNVPGRSLTSSGVTTSSASLISSLLTFFSPPQELVRLTTTVTPLGYGVNRYMYQITNLTDDEVSYTWSEGPIGCNTSFCGNDVRQGGEECDGPDLGGNDCTTIDGGYTGGLLSCDSECGFDTSLCTGGESCGNGVIDEFEQCDGSDLGGASCTSLGYECGTLGCDEGCSYDTSGCSYLCIGSPASGSASGPTAPGGAPHAASTFGETPMPCEYPGFGGRLGAGETTFHCRISAHPAKELSASGLACGPSIPNGPPGCGSGLGTQGTADALVPDMDFWIGENYLSAVRVVASDGSDGRPEPGETVNLTISLLNTGSQDMVGVPPHPIVAHLAAVPTDPDRDGDDDVPYVIVADSAYPILPAVRDVEGDCVDIAPVAIHPVANLTPFVVQFPAGPGDVSYPFTLTVTGQPAAASAGGPTAAAPPPSIEVPLVVGVGGECDPTFITGDFDVLQGLLPPMGALVPAENDTPQPSDITLESATRPLKLKLFCGGRQLTGKDPINPPEIVGLTRNGDPVPLTKIYLDVNSNANDHSLFFRYAGAWIYNLNTTAIGPGVYVVFIQMPDGQVYKSSFAIH